MSRPERQQNVLDLLKGLRGIEPLKQLKQLFWTELNYQRVNQPLSRRGWTESAGQALADDPVLFAGGGDDNAFHVIYCRLMSENLSRTLERPVVTQLLREHPYALFVFSNKGQTDWHFLNVKFDDQAERRRLFRRITVRPGAGLRTATERVQLLDLAEIHPELFGITPLAIQQRCDAAFDVETVTKDFFSEVANWYFWALKNASFPKNAPKETDGHDHISIIRLITRLIFCWFVKEKGLIPDTLFDQQKLAQILTGFDPAKASAKQSVFYKAILQNLFFATLNTEMDKRAWRKEDANFMAHILYRHKTLFQKPSEALDLFKNIPFLNGGLFECLDKREGTPEKPKDIRIDGFSDRSDSQPIVPDFLFFGGEREVDLSEEYDDKKFKSVPVRGLIHIFNRYNFTVEEDTPIDQEVALDPELSGKVFENLLAAYNPETGATARKQTGSFYTPREIVNYMVDESLIASLKTKLETALPSAKNVEARLRQLFAYTDEPHQFTAPEVDALIAAIDSLKTLDPAVGSGAFPMGILHKLVFTLGKLDSHNEKWKERQIQRVRNTIKEAEKTEDAARRDKMVNDLEEQIAGINEAFRLNELDYGRKLYLIENCIYGVDIQPIAVQIAKMRFFISLIVDQKIDDKQPNRGVLPLPNLETKFVSANTLIGIERPDTQGKLFSNPKVDKLKSDLLGIRHRLFTAKSSETKRNLREKDKAVRQALAGEIQKSLAKANEEEISQSRLELEKARKALEEEQSKPVQWETQRMTNLFGEVEETRIDTGKDKRRRLQELVKQLESKLLRANQRDADIDATARRLANWDPYDQNASAGFFDPEWMFGLAEGFDILIGNPPYVRPHKLSDEYKQELWKRFPTFEKKADLYVCFIEKGITLLKDTGEFAFIVSNGCLRLDSFELLRQFVLKQTTIRRIVDFDEDVFESATVKTCILLLEKSAMPGNEVQVAVASAAIEVESLSLRKIPQDKFSRNYKCIFDLSSGNDFDAVKSKMKKDSVQLGNIFDVSFGLKTGDDEKFLAMKPTTKQHRKLLRGEDVGRYTMKFKGEYVWYVPEKMRAHRQTARPGTSERFEQPKVLIRDTGGGLMGTFDGDEYYVKDVLIVSHSSKSASLLKKVTGVLNSKLMRFFYNTSFPTLHVQRNELASLPIKQELLKNDICDEIPASIDRILAAKHKNPFADTSALEDEIDQQVYSLYGLTPEEKKIVDDWNPT